MVGEISYLPYFTCWRHDAALDAASRLGLRKVGEGGGGGGQGTADSLGKLCK